MAKFHQAIFATTLALIVSGCGSSDPTSTDNAKMRETMTSKKPFDINDVPPEYRAKVLQMRGGGGASKPKEAAPATTTGSSPAPKTGS